MRRHRELSYPKGILPLFGLGPLSECLGINLKLSTNKIA